MICRGMVGVEMADGYGWRIEEWHGKEVGHVDGELSLDREDSLS